jgi:hypothetical protein
MRRVFSWAVLAPMAWPAFLFILSAIVLPLVLVRMVASCTPAERAETKNIVEPILDVAGAVCTLESSQPEPDWLAYACTIEKAIAGVGASAQPPQVIHVKVRRAQ